MYRYYYHQISSSVTDAATALDLDLRNVNFWEWVASSAKFSAVTFCCNSKLAKFEVLKVSDTYELCFYNMSIIVEVMSLYQMVVSSINLSPLVSSEELITF
jgi:hypothetical protein